MKAVTHSLILGAFALATFPAYSAEAPAGPKVSAPLWEEGSPAAGKFEELNKDLNMNDKKRAEFRKMFEKMAQQQVQAHEKLQLAVSQLDQVSHDVTAKESAVKEKIEAVEKAQEQINENRKKNHEELRKFFGTIGYARYVAFEESWRGDIRGKARAKFGKKEMPEAAPKAMTAETAPVQPAPAAAVPAQPAAPAAPAAPQAPAPATK